MRNKSEAETETQAPKLRCTQCFNEDMEMMSWSETSRVNYPISMDGTAIVVNKDESVDEEMEDCAIWCDNCGNAFSAPSGLRVDF